MKHLDKIAALRLDDSGTLFVTELR